jgi:hypothetical protein
MAFIQPFCRADNVTRVYPMSEQISLYVCHLGINKKLNLCRMILSTNQMISLFYLYLLIYASSKRHIVQGTHHPRDASSKGRIFQGTHRPRDVPLPTGFPQPPFFRRFPVWKLFSLEQSSGPTNCNNSQGSTERGLFF